MALFKISKGTSERLSNVPIKNGSCYFTTDEHKMYFDIDNQRVSLTTDKIMKKTIGSFKKPIFFLNGEPTLCDDTLDINISGSAQKLTTPRTINLTGDVIGSCSFDGSDNISMGTTVLDNSHSHSNYLSINGGNFSGIINFIKQGRILSGALGENDSWELRQEGENDNGRLTLVLMDNDNDKFFISFRQWDVEGEQPIIHFCYRDIKSYVKLYGAVWNDYAEYRGQTEEIKPGYCVTSNRQGQVSKTTELLQHCEGIVSDTFGFAIGETENCHTPLAVAGRVLVYCSGDRENYSPGDAVCAGPNGLAYKMTEEQIQKYPHRIIGIVSEIPEYKNWGTDNVEVDGRIWIKVK